MRDPRGWTAVLALMCFLAGGAAGLLYAQGRFAPEPPKGPFADYQRLLVDHFQLDAERARVLRGLLESYHEEVERIRDRHTATFLSSMEPELRESGLRYRNIIRSELLPPESRAEFERLVRDYVIEL